MKCFTVIQSLLMEIKKLLRGDTEWEREHSLLLIEMVVKDKVFTHYLTIPGEESKEYYDIFQVIPQSGVVALHSSERSGGLVLLGMANGDDIPDLYGDAPMQEAFANRVNMKAERGKSEEEIFMLETLLFVQLPVVEGHYRDIRDGVQKLADRVQDSEQRILGEISSCLVFSEKEKEEFHKLFRHEPQEKEPRRIKVINKFVTETVLFRIRVCTIAQFLEVHAITDDAVRETVLNNFTKIYDCEVV